jgi:hypothetical protein
MRYSVEIPISLLNGIVHGASMQHDHCTISPIPMSYAARGRYGLLFFSTSSLLSLAPCLVADGWGMSPLLVIWVAGACVRWYRGDSQIMTDCFVFGVLNAFSTRHELGIILSHRLKELDVTVATGLLVGSAIAIALFAYLSKQHTHRKNTASEALPDGMNPATLSYPKPKIFPCETKHARMFPKRHAFEYSYLQCGFPIVPPGVVASGTDNESEADAQLGCWWLRVKAEDYLSRGNGNIGFYTKLKMYLREQVRCFEDSLQYLIRHLNDYSKWTMPNGHTPTLSLHHASLAMPTTLYRSGTSTIQISN